MKREKTGEKNTDTGANREPLAPVVKYDDRGSAPHSIHPVSVSQIPPFPPERSPRALRSETEPAYKR